MTDTPTPDLDAIREQYESGHIGGMWVHNVVPTLLAELAAARERLAKVAEVARLHKRHACACQQQPPRGWGAFILDIVGNE